MKGKLKMETPAASVSDYTMIKTHHTHLLDASKMKPNMVLYKTLKKDQVEFCSRTTRWPFKGHTIYLITLTTFLHLSHCLTWDPRGN